MLAGRPWKSDAILRLALSVLVCLFIGALAGTLIRALQAHATLSPQLIASTAIAVGLFAGALVVLGRPWQLEKITRNFALLLVLVYAGLGLMWWAMRLGDKTGAAENATLKTMVAVLSFQGAALVLIFRFLREHGAGWAEAFGFANGWRRAVLLGGIAGFSFLLVGWSLQEASYLVLERLHVTPEEQPAVHVLRASEHWPDRLVLGIATILLAPLAEEMLFRGILYPALKYSGFRHLAVWGTSLLFAAIHLNLVTFVPLFLLALLLVWLYETTENLLAPITAHGVFNALNFAALYLVQSSGGTHG